MLKGNSGRSGWRKLSDFWNISPYLLRCQRYPKVHSRHVRLKKNHRFIHTSVQHFLSQISKTSRMSIFTFQAFSTVLTPHSRHVCHVRSSTAAQWYTCSGIQWRWRAQRSIGFSAKPMEGTWESTGNIMGISWELSLANSVSGKSWKSWTVTK